jgi:hypothetical protein
MSTPERSQDPGGHGYGATKQDEALRDSDADHPLEDPDLDSRQDEDADAEPSRDGGAGNGE